MSSPAPRPPGLFTELTALELMALRAKVGRGSQAVRRSALRSRSAGQAWRSLQLAGQLTDLGYEIEQELARR